MEKLFSIRSKKGFTMMELLVSITLILLIATVSLPIFSLALQASSQNRIRTTANSLAAGVIEKINNTPFDKIGNKNGAPGAPEGIFDLDSNVTIDGIDYNIKTSITWGETKNLKGEDDNQAFKNVRVTVKAIGAFTQTQEIVGEMFTSVSEKSEQDILGTIKVIMNFASTDSLFYGNGYPIYAYGPLSSKPQTYHSYSKQNGIYSAGALFENMPEGAYQVSPFIPNGYELSAQSKSPQYATVNSRNVETVNFYLDKPENFAKLRVRFVDADTREDIEPYQGFMSLSWELDGVQMQIYESQMFYKPRPYYFTVFDGYFSDLWPFGSYNIEIDVNGYKHFNMQDCTPEEAPYIDPYKHSDKSCSPWFGSFEEFDGIDREQGYIHIVIPLEKESPEPDNFGTIKTIMNFASTDSLLYGNAITVYGPLSGKPPQTYRSYSKQNGIYTTGALFENMPYGTYRVSTEIPNDYQFSAVERGQTSGNYIEKYVTVNSLNVETVDFYIEKPENFAKLRVRFVDADTREDIEPYQGFMSLSWELDGAQMQIYESQMFYKPRPYYFTVFDEYFSDLWPFGSYNIEIDVNDYKHFTMEGVHWSKGPYFDPEQHNTDMPWEGNFQEINYEFVEMHDEYHYIVIPLERE